MLNPLEMKRVAQVVDTSDLLTKASAKQMAITGIGCVKQYADAGWEVVKDAAGAVKDTAIAVKDKAVELGSKAIHHTKRAATAVGSGLKKAWNWAWGSFLMVGDKMMSRQQMMVHANMWHHISKAENWDQVHAAIDNAVEAYNRL
jgi:hypothetical protein